MTLHEELKQIEETNEKIQELNKSLDSVLTQHISDAVIWRAFKAAEWALEHGYKE